MMAWKPLKFRQGLLMLAVVVVLLLTKRAEIPTYGQSACGPTVNAIVCENLNPGNPASEWDVSGAGDANLQGFPTDISVLPGQTQRFKIDTTPAASRWRSIASDTTAARARGKSRQ